MDTSVWERAQLAVGDVDRRETKAVRSAVLAVVAALVLLIVIDQLGVSRPGLRFSGSAGGSAEAASATAQVELDLTSRGLVSERLASVQIDYPGLTVTRAALEPSPMGFRDSGRLILDLAVECGARTAEGAPAWAEETTQAAESPLIVRTHRPWGAAVMASSGAADAVFSTASLACRP